METLPSEPFWLGYVKLGSRSTIPTLIDPSDIVSQTDENYTTQQLQQQLQQQHMLNNDTFGKDQTSESWSFNHSGTLVLVGVFVCTFLQVFPMWWLGWNACLHVCLQYISTAGQYVLTSSMLPTIVRRFFLLLFSCCCKSFGASLSLSPSSSSLSISSKKFNNTTPASRKRTFDILPKHIAIIMDGNRRYGKEMHGDTGRGHVDGGRTLSRVIDFCLEFNIQVLTVYAFSTENWNRSQNEIDLLMDIFIAQADEIMLESMKRDVQVKILSSNPLKLPKKVTAKFNELEHITKNGSSLILNLCVSYGGRGDIVNACKHVGRELLNGNIQNVNDINENVLSRYMLTSHCQVPDPDLLIRKFICHDDTKLMCKNLSLSLSLTHTHTHTFHFNFFILYRHIW